jgi:hypothetical protein
MSWLRLMEESIAHEPAPPGKPRRFRKLIAEMWPAYLIEILVIILGISITLVLEEWRDHQREQQLEKIYETNLLADITVDQKSLADVTDSTELLIKKGEDLLNHPSSATLYADLRGILSRPNFTSGDATFSDLKSSGNLRLLSDISLKNGLFAYYSLTQNLKENQDAEREATIALTGAYFLKRFPLATGKDRPMSEQDLRRLSTDNEFSNNVLLRVSTRKELLDGYRRAAELGVRLQTALSIKVKD